MDRNYDFSSKKIDGMQYIECAGCANLSIKQSLQSSSMAFKKVHYTISNSHPKLVVKNQFSKHCSSEVQGLFKYFQGPVVFSSTFKGLEFQEQNSSTFKDFSTTL